MSSWQPIITRSKLKHLLVLNEGWGRAFEEGSLGRQDHDDLDVILEALLLATTQPAVAWRHTLTLDDGTGYSVISEDFNAPFTPGIDTASSSTVDREPLYTPVQAYGRSIAAEEVMALVDSLVKRAWSNGNSQAMAGFQDRWEQDKARQQVERALHKFFQTQPGNPPPTGVRMDE